MEAENEQLKRENETLKRENAELKEMNDKLKQSLDDAVRSTRPKPQLPPRQLIRQLLDTQDRLTVAEQVTAATQRRELVQEGVYENLPSTGVYEELRFDPTQEHVYTALQPITHSGCCNILQYAYCFHLYLDNRHSIGPRS